LPFERSASPRRHRSSSQTAVAGRSGADNVHTRDPHASIFRWFDLCAANAAAPQRERLMLDVILIAVGCGTFALAIAYAYACDRL
jgi:hypothetical protein